MAKTRMINTRFWIDDYIANLDPVEKLLFLYLLTNPATDISGCYELPLKNMALDTGIEKEMLIKILKRFTRDRKIYYHKGWVGIVNFIKHQSVNPKVLQGIEIGLAKAPNELRDRLSKPIDSLSHLNSNLNSDSNSNSDSSPDRLPTPEEKNREFFTRMESGEESEKVVNALASEHDGHHDFFRRELKSFVLYWTEPTRSGKKVKWETESTFDVRRRLQKWFTNADKWGKVGIKNQSNSKGYVL